MIEMLILSRFTIIFGINTAISFFFRSVFSPFLTAFIELGTFYEGFFQKN